MSDTKREQLGVCESWCECGHCEARHCRYVDITDDPLGPEHTECVVDGCGCTSFKRRPIEASAPTESDIEEAVRVVDALIRNREWRQMTTAETSRAIMTALVELRWRKG